MMVPFPTALTPIHCPGEKAPDPQRRIRRSGESVAQITATAASIPMDDAGAPDPQRRIRRSGESVAQITATAASIPMDDIALQEQAR
jgi:hypothetical protein